MSLNNKIACPLDCYDTCQASLNNGKIKGEKEHFTTKGKLCVNFASLLKEDFLTTPKYDNKDISLQESLDILEDKLKNTSKDKTLYYKGYGNIGVMQNAPKNFFLKHGAVLTKGSTCDGGGKLGLEQGRGSAQNPSIDDLINSDVIVVWGRNFSVTSSHMYNLVKDKIFITIDPIKTHIAKKSKLHLQINPKTDYELALYFTRLAFMHQLDNEEYLEEFTNGYDWFFELSKNKPLVEYEKNTGVSLDEAYKFFELIKNKTVSFVLGLGVQKYFEGTQIIRCIDSFATFLGIHNQQKGGGVWYLSDSSYGYENQFDYESKTKKIPITNVDFNDYDLVFIQGGNPVVTSPNSAFLINGLKNSFVVYFGTTLNDTSKYANLIIPSTNFLAKRDVRLSYGHEFVAYSDIVNEPNKNTITEYNLTKYLIEKFGYEVLKNEDEIIDYYKNKKIEYKKHENFEFIEEIEIEPLYKHKSEDEFYLITAKSKKSLNSQFKIDNCVYLNSANNFKDGDEVKISSKYGNAIFQVKINDDIKQNCAFFYSGNKKVNYLTPNKDDEQSFSAMFQEVLIKIDLL